MKSKAILVFCILMAAVFVVIYLIPIWNTPKLNLEQIEQDEQEIGPRSQWTRKTVGGVELLVAWKKVTHPPDGEWLHVYALMEGQHFNEGTLRQLFASLSEEYSKYKHLDVVINSDEVELTKQIDQARLSFITTSHQHMPQEKAKEEKPPRNYFDVYYTRLARIDGSRLESFSYTPDPTKDDSIKIILKE